MIQEEKGFGKGGVGRGKEQNDPGASKTRAFWGAHTTLGEESSMVVRESGEETNRAENAGSGQEKYGLWKLLWGNRGERRAHQRKSLQECPGAHVQASHLVGIRQFLGDVNTGEEGSPMRPTALTFQTGAAGSGCVDAGAKETKAGGP